ncbi:hypothetical protein PMN64_16495, partial [Bradyrhizobium sp. UFLA01-814]|uniref:hypothetical protein n=1 Tax=Bradyrhizobium sp. UFLA01-814 TaxID=3023480 RepID=UPI00398A9A8B
MDVACAGDDTALFEHLGLRTIPIVVLAKARTHYPESQLLHALQPRSRSSPIAVVMGPCSRAQLRTR